MRSTLRTRGPNDTGEYEGPQTAEDTRLYELGRKIARETAEEIERQLEEDDAESDW